nr:hypothetical protein CFP56_14550 [Quercus suber]
MMAEEDSSQPHKLTEELKKVIEDKDKEIRQAKETAVLEYRDSNTLLNELEVSFGDAFDEAICQVKALYPLLDLSSVNINDAEQTSILPAQYEDTDELFGDKAPPDVPLDQVVVESDPKDGQSRRSEEKEAPVVD